MTAHPPLSPEAARQALADIDSVSQQTRLAVQSSVVSSILMLWGVLWAIIFSAGYLVPQRGDRIALVLNAFGFLATAVLVARQQRASRDAAAIRYQRRLAVLWAVLLVYAILLPVLLMPSWSGRLAMMLSLIMLGYVLQGIWMKDRVFVLLGVFITAVAVAGRMFLSPPHFLLGLGFLGGGALFTGGLVIRLRWK
jgi:hypothetical protein